MITKTPKFLYFLIFLIALTSADAWRRSLQQNDLAVNQAVSPLRKNIIDLNRELSEIKTLLEKQQTLILKLEGQIKKQRILPVEQQKKTIDLINPDENKLLDQLVNGIVEKNIAEIKPTETTDNNKLDGFPDISALAATNVTLKTHKNVAYDNLPGEKPVKKEKRNRQIEKKVAEVPVVEIDTENLTPLPQNKNKQKQKLPQLKRVTSTPAHTAVPEVVIPDKNPDLTSKTIDGKVEASTPAATSLSQTMLSGKKRGVRVTISDVLESYDNN